MAPQYTKYRSPDSGWNTKVPWKFIGTILLMIVLFRLGISIGNTQPRRDDSGAVEYPLFYQFKRITPGLVHNGAGGCIISGCGGESCIDANSSEAFKCEVAKGARALESCYQFAICERQPTGRCGWTETKKFDSCENPFGSNTIEL